jgi:hypothetical protein
MIGSSDAIQTKHQWQVDSLRAPAANAQIEGDNASLNEVTETVMKEAYCQISAEMFGVSGTLEVTKKWGRDSELAYQAAKAARQLKTDVDYTITGLDQISAAGDATTARTTGSLTSWIETNYVSATDGTSGSDGSTAITDGSSLDPYVQADLDTSIQTAWNNGGRPSVILLGAYQKANMSYFDGIGSSKADTSKHVGRMDRAGRTIYATADLYVSNFGELRIVPSRHIRVTSSVDRNVFILDPEYLKIAYLRPWQQFDLAKTGDSIQREMLVEWCLEVCNEAAHGLVADLDNLTS